jgi:hypothetical protein
VDGIEVYGVNRDDKEILLKSLSATATSYQLNDATKVTQYKTFKVTYYRVEDNEKIYGEPWEVENSYFSEYLLSDGITGIKYPTKSQIKKMWKKLSPTSKADKFSTKPTNKKTFKKGAVAQSTLKNGLNTLNFIRYVAGISSNQKILPVPRTGRRGGQLQRQNIVDQPYSGKTCGNERFPVQSGILGFLTIQSGGRIQQPAQGNFRMDVGLRFLQCGQGWSQKMVS